MGFVKTLFIVLAWLSAGSLWAAQEPRPGCDSCKIEVKSLSEPVKLTGQWLFTRDDDLKNAAVDADTSAWTLVKTPGPWKNAYKDGKNFTTGWYRGVFEFDDSLIGKDVVLLLNTYMGRVNVYNNGKEVYRRPGDINVERYYATQPIPVRFTVTQRQHVLAIRVDTLLMVGVYQLPFELRAYSNADGSLAWYQFQNGELRVISAFVAFFFGLFFLLVYRKTGYPLYLAASSMGIVVFPFFVAPSDILMRVVPPEPMLLLHYVGLVMFLPAYLYSQFFYKFTPRTNWVLGSLMGAMALVIAAQVFHLNLDLFQKVRSVFFLTSLLLGTLTLYQCFRGMLAKKMGAIPMFIGISIFYASGVHDMLLSFGVINSMSTLFYGVLGFVASMLYVSCIIFADTFVQNKRITADLKVMNENLEDLVAQRTQQLRQKTNDIQTMLQNMPQGIMTITQDGTIHPEYSAYLEQIFETKDIAGRPIMDVVFAHTNLGTDLLSQIEAVAGACIGEDRMNFEFNSHLMVTEFEKTMASGKVKSLELSWSPICDESDTCEKLMICVRDVTELKGLAAEANKQRLELEMIGQVLSVNQEKFHQFIDSACQFVDENRNIIENTKERDIETITQLFRNMHTIKGNARTYGFLQLTNTVHETEQTYDRLRKDDSANWDREHLLQQLRETQEAISRYAHVNDVKLGRKGPGRRGGVDRFLMVQKEQIEALIHELKSEQTQAGGYSPDLYHRVLSTLQQFGTERIGDVLAGVVDSVPSLAKELGKETPTIVIKDHDVVVRTQIADLLKNVFMHLFRNSVDHGLEPAERRVQSGKAPAGTITLDMSLQEGQLLFRLKDDGKGLALSHIRKKATESGLIREGEQLSPKDLAQLIFAPGFSTASTVTEVSGRGVGMDAVKAFVEREGGTIELRLQDASSADGFQPFETLISLPAKFGYQLTA